jgi:hypothetical protein
VELQYHVDDFTVKLGTLDELVRCGGDLLRPRDPSFAAPAIVFLFAGAVGEVAEHSAEPGPRGFRGSRWGSDRGQPRLLHDIVCPSLVDDEALSQPLHPAGVLEEELRIERFLVAVHDVDLALSILQDRVTGQNDERK